MNCHADKCRHCSAQVLLAMPVYNEEKYVDSALDAVLRHIDDVVVIDDGSTDDSKLILARRDDICVISHPDNRGYGRSIIDGFNFARGCSFKWLITMDCDLQHEPARIPDFLAAIEADDADVISGSRYLHNVLPADCPPADRRHINHTVTGWVNETLGFALTDAFCGFKAYRVVALERLALSEPGYAMPLEFWVQAGYHGLRVREIPVNLIYNDPNRYFGGNLDDPRTRLQHYQQVFQQALGRVGWEHRFDLHAQVSEV